MKSILILVLATGLYSCGNETTEKKLQAAPDSSLSKQQALNAQKSNTLNPEWINHFRDFRNALYNNDINKIKTYFSFPVVNINNEIWSVVLADSTDIFTGYSSDPLTPFTEKDLDRYYKKLFPKEFISSILKLKSDVLFKTNNASVELSTSDRATGGTMYASVDKEDHTLSLVLSFITVVNDDNGNSEDAGEASIGYTFLIQKDGRLLFKEVRIAG